MKRLIVTLIVVSAMITALAPGASAEFRYGPIAGPVLSNLKFKQDLVTVDQVVGFTAGVQGEMMFPGIGFGIDIGLMYNQLGAKVNLGERKIWASEGYGNERLYLHTLQIPFHLRFKYTRLNGFEEVLAPLLFAGPDFTLQVGHSKCDAIKWSGGDLGLTVGGGAEISQNWQVTVSYTWGMTYALKTKLLDDFSAQSRNWALRVVYLF